MSVNSPVVGIVTGRRDQALAAVVAPETPIVECRTRRRECGLHRDPRATFWRTTWQECVYFLTFAQVRPWVRARVAITAS